MKIPLSKPATRLPRRRCVPHVMGARGSSAGGLCAFGAPARRSVGALYVYVAVGQYAGNEPTLTARGPGTRPPS